MSTRSARIPGRQGNPRCRRAFLITHRYQRVLVEVAGALNLISRAPGPKHRDPHPGPIEGPTRNHKRLCG